MEPMKRALRELFAIDPRSLAAFRIAIGIVLLADLGIRAADLGAMYTDDGMFSRTLIGRHYSVWSWSLHFGGGSWWYQAGLFGLAAAFALALLAGFGTRLAAAASWALLVSLHNRVPLVLSGADNLLRMLLFWGVFLPLGGVWSADAWLAKRKSTRRTDVEPVLSVASAAILLQMAFVYLFSAAFKSNGDWLQGRAVAAILADAFYGKPIASKLLEFPAALAALTAGILAIEWLAPLFLFSPIWTGRIRLTLVGLLAALHAGIEVLMNVGAFSLVSLSGLILFLPPSFWETLRARFRRRAEEPERAGASDGARPRPAPATVSAAAQVACALALAYVSFANINGLAGHLLPGTPAPANELLTVGFGLGQKWDMFSSPPPLNGWCVARAILADGAHVDLLRGGAPVVWDRPRDAAAAYPSHRWLKLFRELSYAEAEGIEVFRRPVAEYLCRDWNRGRAADRQVVDFVLVFCADRKHDDGFGIGPAAMRATLVHLDFAAREGEG
jgi:hypothetical protein